MERDTLFIGHANPEDNEFTLWLQAKLINQGYKVECDLSFLIGGEEDYWKKLQDLLENNSAKYILVLSKTTFSKQGVIDEWEQVKSIAKKNGLTDFIYVLKIDDVAFDVRIGVPTKNHFRFDVSWAKGLKQLFIKLHRDQVPKNQNAPLSIEAWSKNRYSTSYGVLEKEETYYSNWLEISRLPEKLYFFHYDNDTQAETIAKSITDYPVFRHDNYIITFSDSLPLRVEEHDFDIIYKGRLEVPVSKAFKKYTTIDFPVYDDLRRFLVRILKEAWNKHLSNKSLNYYNLSDKTKCFYYIKNQLEKDKVFFKYKNKSTYKQLLGDFGETTWHYALSATPTLNPVFCYSVRAHLVFSDDGQTVWKAKNKMHKARRSKGKSFFNKEWRGLMLAFLSSISNEKNEISIPLTSTVNLEISNTPILFTCDFGYDEPKTDGRMVPLDYFDEMIDEEELNELKEIEENEQGNETI
jgi:hypothetical protein